jgi:hypothetical protein
MTTYANLYASGNGIRLAYMIQNEVNTLLADPTNIAMYPGILNIGSIDGMGSDTLTARYVNLGYGDVFASTGDGSAVSASSITPSNVDVTVARYALRYDLTSLAQMSGYGQDLNPFSLSQMMFQSATATMSQLVATEFQNITNTVGTSGADLSVDNILDAIFELEDDANSEFTCILHSVQFADFRQSLRSETNNALGFASETYEAMKAKAPGYAGSWGGVNFFKSNRVTEVTGNKVGAMLGANAIGYALGTPQNSQLADGRIVEAGTPAIIEWTRNAASDKTEIVGNMYFGVKVLEQARAVGIVTDA